MRIWIEPFETLPQGEVFVCKMENDRGASAEILSYGGIIRCLRTPDRNGGIRDVVLGHDSIQNGYLSGYPYAAMLIGRFANRIKGGSFTTAEGTWTLEKNENENTLHGASGGYDSRLFQMQTETAPDAVHAILTLIDHGEAGFPGTVEVKVVYTLHSDNRFEISYYAVPDRDTVLSLTNHVYFNLAGHDQGTTHRQYLRIACDFYTPSGTDCVPTGEVLKVDGTVFDFREFRTLGSGYDSGDPQLAMFNGYDHNLCLRGRGMRTVLEAYDPESGITLDLQTDLPGAQLYTTNYTAPADVLAKDGAHYQLHQGFCFETQHFPNSPVFSHFPSPYVRAGETYESHTVFKFGILK